MTCISTSNPLPQSGPVYVLRHHMAGHFRPGHSNVYPSLGEPAKSPEEEWQAKMTVQVREARG